MILVELEDIGKNITFFKNTEPLFIFSGYIDEKSGNIINVRNTFNPSVELPDIPYNIAYYGEVINQNVQYNYKIYINHTLQHFREARKEMYYNTEFRKSVQYQLTELPAIKKCFDERGYHGCFVQFHLSEKMVDMALRRYDDMYNRDSDKFDFTREKDIAEFELYTSFVCDDFQYGKRENLIIGAKINNKTYDVFQNF